MMKPRFSPLFLCLLLSTALAAQPRITPPKNNYPPKQDVELGLQAAAQARQQLPIMHDDAVSSYMDELGRRLVAAIPPELQHPEFRYSFEPVNVREINAFALPGGPMFINRGMIEAANAEGEVAGVMAHELSHVVLRHGTAQASRATKYEIGEIAGAVLGAIIGGRVGNVVAQGTQFGIGTAFMRFSREYEKQADLEGAQIMARAGYDPRDMANMFKTIEKQSGSGGPEWLSDHPNPGNRFEYITKEAESLRVDNPIRGSRTFEQVRAHLRSLPRAPTTEEATRNAPQGSTTSRGPDARPAGRVQPPSSRYVEFNEGDIFRVSVPANWREMSAGSSVTFAPDGAVGQMNGHGVFTHGIELGLTRNETHDLETATNELIDSLRQSNPEMSQPSSNRTGSIDRNRALQTSVSNVSEVTGRPEIIRIATTRLNDGSLFYAIAVAPQDELRDYDGVFQRILGSIRFAR